MLPNKKSLALPLLAVTMAAALTGCIPESKESLVDPSAARPDYGLIGLWQLKQDNGDVQYYHIGLEPEKPLDPRRSTPESGLMKFWLITHSAQHRVVGNAFGMQMLVASVGDAQYASLVVPQGEPGANAANTYWFIKYQVDKDMLTTWGMGWEAAAKVIEQGKLTGTIERDAEGKLKRVLLTASREQLQAFLKDHSTELFLPEGKNTYRRVPAG